MELRKSCRGPRAAARGGDSSSALLGTGFYLLLPPTTALLQPLPMPTSELLLSLPAGLQHAALASLVDTARREKKNLDRETTAPQMIAQSSSMLPLVHRFRKS